MEVDVEEMKCDDIVNKSKWWNMEFSDDAMKDKVSVVLIKVQVWIKKIECIRRKAVVSSVDNANMRRMRLENDTVVIK